MSKHGGHDVFSAPIASGASTSFTTTTWKWVMALPSPTRRVRAFTVILFVISGSSFHREGRKIVNALKCGRYNRYIVISGDRYKWVKNASSV